MSLPCPCSSFCSCLIAYLCSRSFRARPVVSSTLSCSTRSRQDTASRVHRQPGSIQLVLGPCKEEGGGKDLLLELLVDGIHGILDRDAL